MGLRTFSSGGGVDSTAVLVLAAQGKLAYDAFLFCDVGADSERKGTVAYHREVALPYAERHGIPFHTLTKRPKRGRFAGQQETLYKRLTWPESRSLPIPVRMSNGAPGRRACTESFKIDLVARWQREHGATPEDPAVCGLGIAYDERLRQRTDSGFPYQVLEYPLVDLGLTRADCMTVIRSAGLPVPPKSACWFCPMRRPSEWNRMRHEEPEEFAAACDLEDLLNERRLLLGKDQVWLTRFAKPLRELPDQLPLLGFEELDNCESGFCWT